MSGLVEVVVIFVVVVVVITTYRCLGLEVEEKDNCLLIW